MLLKAKTGFFSSRPVFREVDSLTCEMDLDDGMGYTVRAAFFHGVRQHGGEYADAAEYRMDVYDTADGSVAVAGFTVSSDAAVHLPAGSLADYGDDDLIGELARRLNGR